MNILRDLLARRTRPGTLELPRDEFPPPYSLALEKQPPPYTLNPEKQPLLTRRDDDPCAVSSDEDLASAAPSSASQTPQAGPSNPQPLAVSLTPPSSRTSQMSEAASSSSQPLTISLTPPRAPPSMRTWAITAAAAAGSQVSGLASHPLVSGSADAKRVQCRCGNVHDTTTKPNSTVWCTCGYLVYDDGSTRIVTNYSRPIYQNVVLWKADPKRVKCRCGHHSDTTISASGAVPCKKCSYLVYSDGSSRFVSDVPRPARSLSKDWWKKAV